MVYLVRLSTCNLNQWALDFDGNLERVLESIDRVIADGSSYRTGPELELCGYGCEDHLLELDTELHCWQSVRAIMLHMQQHANARPVDSASLSPASSSSSSSLPVARLRAVSAAPSPASASSAAAYANLLFDVGMPLIFQGARYNVRLVIHNSRIVLIRPKLWLANDGNYREMRYFAAWPTSSSSSHSAPLLTFQLPEIISSLFGQESCSIGVVNVACRDVTLGYETCEELFTPLSPHIAACLSGADIISNSSGSHHSLRKLTQRIDLLRSASSKTCSAYLYSNQQGCDGNRLYYDGCASIFVAGKLLAQGSQFSLKDVQVVTATIDVDELRAQRAAMPSRSNQAAQHALANAHSSFAISCAASSSSPSYAASSSSPPSSIASSYAVQVNTYMGVKRVHSHFGVQMLTQETRVSPAIEPRIHTPEEEIAFGPACWLWDYLRRSKQAGFFLPLSGGADSAATAAIVASMCRLVVKSCVEEGDREIIAQVASVLAASGITSSNLPSSTPSSSAPNSPSSVSSSTASTPRVTPAPSTSPVHHASTPVDASARTDGLPIHFPYPFTAQSLAHQLFHTCYLSTDNSGNATKQRAALLAQQIGAYHLQVNIQLIVDACVKTLHTALALVLRYKLYGGQEAENLALQNLQARTRMLMSYALASLLPLARGRSRGSLLVLGSANVDEALRGYLTKYDCSSADLNPIGAISKADLKRFLRYAASSLKLTALVEIIEAAPTAELEPSNEGYVQTDEQDMGMSYDELGQYGRLRQLQRCGPVSMFMQLARTWSDTRQLSLSEVATKVKRFFFYYAINRHKSTVLTPSYHAENYSPDDHRFDHRPFLYNATWSRQFNHIDELVKHGDQDEVDSGISVVSRL